MEKNKRVRTLKKQPLNNHVQTSLNDMEYKAITPLILAKGESAAIREVIKYAINKGFLTTI